MSFPKIIIGECSLCHGKVMMPDRNGIDIPSAQCNSCGAKPVQPYNAIVKMDVNTSDSVLKREKGNHV